MPQEMKYKTIELPENNNICPITDKPHRVEYINDKHKTKGAGGRCKDCNAPFSDAQMFG
jgi:hypothetical protein